MAQFNDIVYRIQGNFMLENDHILLQQFVLNAVHIGTVNCRIGPGYDYDCIIVVSDRNDRDPCRHALHSPDKLRVHAVGPEIVRHFLSVLVIPDAAEHGNGASQP